MLSPKEAGVPEGATSHRNCRRARPARSDLTVCRRRSPWLTLRPDRSGLEPNGSNIGLRPEQPPCTRSRSLWPKVTTLCPPARHRALESRSRGVCESFLLTRGRIDRSREPPTTLRHHRNHREGCWECADAAMCPRFPLRPRIRRASSKCPAASALRPRFRPAHRQNRDGASSGYWATWALHRRFRRAGRSCLRMASRGCPATSLRRLHPARRWSRAGPSLECEDAVQSYHRRLRRPR